MANESDPAGGEAQRFREERDEARAQLAEATRVLSNYQRRDAAFLALEGKVENPFHVADLLAPHLGSVKVEDVGAHVLSEGFAPRLSAFKAPGGESPLPTGEQLEEGEETPATETPGFGGGPSFGGSGGGGQQVPQEQKIVVGSTEWQELLAGDDRGAIDAAYKAGRIIEPARGY